MAKIIKEAPKFCQFKCSCVSDTTISISTCKSNIYWITSNKQSELYYFLKAGDNVGVFPSILQVELPVRRPEVVVVDWGEGGVTQLDEDPLRVDTWTSLLELETMVNTKIRNHGEAN